ncbi:uncharacterized protein DUF4254 [Nocardia alba]|uniref:Uncharacterized protein DUF4254 n=1 Tax=Nocardia alba TaxID=225051 RepID=A0A4R1FHG4_9NOCA|nr:uncharacterized protein DUF4254 [Nocardia alba]
MSFDKRCTIDDRDGAATVDTDGSGSTGRPGPEQALPDRNRMMQAVCGVAGVGDPVLSAAHELATLHERREQQIPGDTSEIDWARARLVCEIDRWVVIRSPTPATSAPMHTESIGAVVDRMAHFAALTYRALACGAEAPLHAAQARLHELACGYDDLIAEVASGARRLPDGLDNETPESDGTPEIRNTPRTE